MLCCLLTNPTIAFNCHLTPATFYIFLQWNEKYRSR